MMEYYMIYCDKLSQWNNDGSLQSIQFRKCLNKCSHVGRHKNNIETHATLH